MKFVLLSLFLFYNLVFAIDRQTIITSDDYYYGTGLSEDQNEARQKALSAVTEQISVRVESKLINKTVEDNGNVAENVKSILRTYSFAKLNNVGYQTARKGSKIEVFAYIAKKEVARIFENRKELISEMYRQANRYREEGNLAYALKLYYFSTILMNSIPDERIYYAGTDFTTEIPKAIHSILLDTKFKYVKSKVNSDGLLNLFLNVTYENKPVSLLDFTYWNGMEQVAVQVKDGNAVVTMNKDSIQNNEINLNIKYAYYENRNEYLVVRDLWDLVFRPSFSVPKKVALTNLVEKTFSNALNDSLEIRLNYKEPLPAISTIRNETLRFIHIIQGKEKAFYEDRFIEQKLKKYLDYNHPRLYSYHIQADINKTSMGYELRRIAVTHDYPSISKHSVEYLTLDFSTDGKLLDFNVSISKNLYNEFVTQSKFGKDWGNRQAIIKFIERYRMAYLTRDLNTIDLMFAEEALILVGRRIKKQKKLSKDFLSYKRFRGQPEYEMIRLSKQQYINRLNRVFRSQEDIFLNFGSFDIFKKHNAPKIYGVEMRQSYASTTYADEGYLFLLIDFNGRDPLIYIRAWQPNEWDKKALVNTANFRIYK